ncbi:F-box/kelch-repeat protein At3g23880-like [Salvia miltiorrhiza]|uniref:F-box/kelch-repeat protein At3g23880-like n=1 Tax=Salvia miltiorrhiza TaxID=226208 RepID=UPI0025ACFCA4|nr:F-box/kelch-repeat protein At3g23880-like [Salvia miltiorrhiza]
MNNLKKQRVLSGEEVVEDLIPEILCRVAEVKSVLRFRCVSKSWRSLIDSGFFIDKHAKKARNTAAAHGHERVVFNARGESNQCCVWWCYLDESTPALMDMDPTNAHLAAAHVIGHCNGLLCILDAGEGRIFLWNPATRISAELPRLEHKRIAKCGFGWDEETCAYKVFVGWRNDDADDEGHMIMGARVYSSNTNCWEQVETHGSDIYIHWIGASSSWGKIHWLVPTGLGFGVRLESFDLKTESFATTELPCVGGLGVCLTLRERQDGCLSLVRCVDRHTTRTVWVMKSSHASWLQDSRYDTTFRGCYGGSFPYLQTLLRLPF